MESKHLDLVDIARLVNRKKWFLIIFALCAVAIGLVFCLVASRQYTSRTVFIVRSPQNMDRNHLVRQDGYQDNNFFATENEIDNIMTISKNEVLLQFLVDSLKLQKHYGVNSGGAAFRKLSRSFKVVRNDTRSIEYSISDPDPDMAAKLVNTARWEADNLFRDFFKQAKQEIIVTLNKTVTRINQQIKQADDSILQIRNQYQLFQSLLPTRGTIIAPKNSINSLNPKKVDGLELLQRATYRKDQLLGEYAKYTSLIKEYQIQSTGNEMDMFYTVQYGWPSDVPSFPKFPLILGICFFAGLGFAFILV